jgi:hypothetical protein
VDRSVAQGRPADPTAPWPHPGAARLLLLAVGVGLVALALAVYLSTRTVRFYDHFVWQAAAFLEGQTAIRYPVFASDLTAGNYYFQDVLPVIVTDGISRAILPFPPLPAVLLLPFVAVWGLGTNDHLVFTIIAAIDVGICWWMLGRLDIRVAIRLATTLFFAFGTVFWYAAQLATTWYEAHIAAIGLTMLAVGLALRADPRAQADGSAEPPAATSADRVPDVGRRRGRRRPWSVEPRQFVSGFLFGLACTARLTVVLAAPFFLLVGAGGSFWRRGWSAALGAAIPIGLLVAYNVVSTGHIVNPAYDYLYRIEAAGYPSLGYRPDWAIEDARYLPQNIGIMLFTAPDILPSHLPDALGVANTPVCTEPGAQRGLFDARCPLAVPSDIGMSLFLVSPAYLLGFAALRDYGRVRLVTGAALAVLLIAVVNLMHFSQGWVQFGYRFSNDFAPFALLLVALGFERLARRHAWGMSLGMALVVLSIAVNFWGVAWGRLLGW